MKKHLIYGFGAALAAVMLFSGCANHLEDITKEIPENTRNVLGSQYVITMEKEIPIQVRSRSRSMRSKR